jgi:transcriptional regulator with XRE-family HTH domain
MDYSQGQPPPEWWSAPVVAAALAKCDFATLLEEIRRGRGWTQKQLAQAVGYSQSWVSNVLRRQQALTVDQVREISHRLGIPIHLLRFGSSGGGDPTKRREFNKAMALALVPLPARSEADEMTAPTLTAITGAQRRLDAMTPARELSRGVASHVEMANRMLSRARKSPFATDIAAAVSEAAGFAAWLHADMYDIGTARTYYRLAIDRARFAGQDLLAAYMLGSLAAFEIDINDTGPALALIAEARQQLGGASHPTPLAWLDSIEALGLACVGESDNADRTLGRASNIIERGESSDSVPWPWVFAFDHAKLAGYRALVAVRLNRPEDALTHFADSLSGTQPAPKQRATVMLEVATAARQDGIERKDSERIDESFRLASEALGIGITYSSERVMEKARRFRRSYLGPATIYSQNFDEQLRSTLS